MKLRKRGNRTGTNNGYRIVYLPPGHPQRNSGGWQYEHRLRLWAANGRPARFDADTHHRNGRRRDCRNSNLRLIDHAEHARHHAKRKPRDARGRFAKRSAA